MANEEIADHKEDPRVNTARVNLRMAVALRGTNLSKVSVKAGLSRNGLGQFINGQTTLSYRNILAICDVLNIPIGIVHRPDSITESKIRIYQALDHLPDHLLDEALQAAKAPKD